MSGETNDVETCVSCSEKLTFECFVLQCAHIVCFNCGLKGNVNCKQHQFQQVKCPSVYHEETKKTIIFGNLIGFSLDLTGQCNINSCEQETFADIKQCGHQLCKSCIERIYHSEQDNGFQYVSCGLKLCGTSTATPCNGKRACLKWRRFLCQDLFGKTELLIVPLPRYRCQLGGMILKFLHKCQKIIRKQCYRFNHIVFESSDWNCALQNEANQKCNAKEYLHTNDFDACFRCFHSVAKSTHTPEYFEQELVDIMPCPMQKCTDIIVNPRKVLMDIADIRLNNSVYVLEKSDIILCTFCTSEKVSVALSCGHNYCRSCFVNYTSIKYIDINDTQIRSRICYRCRKWVKEPAESPLADILVEDFLAQSTRSCRAHSESLVETKCCFIKKCQTCLSDALNESVVTRELYGQEFSDLVKCDQYCNKGVPKSVIKKCLLSYYSLTDSKEEKPVEAVTSNHLERSRKRTSLGTDNPNTDEVKKERMQLDTEKDKRCDACGNEAFAALDCKHTLCRECMTTLTKCGAIGCNQEIPREMVAALIEKSFADLQNLEPIEEATCNYIECKNKADFYLPCKHGICKHCIKLWIKRCPASGCSQEMSVDEIKELRKTPKQRACSVTDNLHKDKSEKDEKELIIAKDKHCKNCINDAWATLFCMHSFCMECMTTLTKCSVYGCNQEIHREKVAALIDESFAKAEQDNTELPSSELEKGSTKKKDTQNVHGASNDTSKEPAPANLAIEIKGVRNLGFTCYANSIFQVLGQTKGFVNKLKTAVIKSKFENIQLTDNLMVLLTQINENSSDYTVSLDAIRGLLGHIFSLDKTFANYEQQDCFEFLMCLLEKLALEDSETTSIFEIKTQTVFTFKACKHKQVCPEQVLKSLLIPLCKDEKSSYTVDSGLENLLCTPEIFKSGVLPCKTCNTNTMATEKYFTLTKTPDILIIQIGRVNTKQRWFRKYTYLQKEEFLVKYNAIVTIPETIEIEKNPSYRMHQYQLYGVVLHTGSVNSGHYYSYVRKLDTDQWFLCNDSSVRPIQKSEVFDNRNAYLLFYERFDRDSGSQANEAC